METKDLAFLGYPGYKVREDGWLINPRGRLIGGNANRQVKLHDGFKALAWIVASAFVPNPNGFMFVVFKDGDNQNLHYTNLEWAPRRVHGNTKQAWILARLNEGISVEEIASGLKVSPSYIRGIAARRLRDLEESKLFQNPEQ